MGEEKNAILNKEELKRLTDCWLIWREQARGTGRSVARSRLCLYFLLVRFGALRSAEIATFARCASLDRQTGLLRLRDRRFFLPPQAMRVIRVILALPEASSEDFLRLDAGFVRRTFYDLARMAELPAEACAPRALRYARAAELLDLHMPAQIVARNLGISVLRLEQVLSGVTRKNREINHFAAIVIGLETDLRCGRLLLECASNFMLTGIFSLETLADFEPDIGKKLNIHIPSGLIFPSPFPLPMANCLKCKVRSLTRDGLEARLLLALSSDFELMASLDGTELADIDLTRGAIINTYIPAHALRLINSA